MTTVNDELLAERLTTHTFGRTLEHVREAASTMDLAQAALAAGAGDGSLFIADHQTAGRGARGRTWAATPGASLTFSLVVKPLRGDGLLALAVGVGVAESLSSLGIGCELKWPNDVFVHGKKIAGVLVETRSVGGRPPEAAIVGVGINLAPQAYPADADAIDVRTALSGEGGADVDPTELLARLLEHVEAALELVARAPAAVVSRIDERLAWRGRLVRVDDESGELEGLEHDGSLRLRTPGGESRLVRAGTLRLA